MYYHWWSNLCVCKLAFHSSKLHKSEIPPFILHYPDSLLCSSPLFQSWKDRSIKWRPAAGTDELCVCVIILQDVCSLSLKMSLLMLFAACFWAFEHWKWTFFCETQRLNTPADFPLVQNYNWFRSTSNSTQIFASYAGNDIMLSLTQFKKSIFIFAVIQSYHSCILKRRSVKFIRIRDSFHSFKSVKTKHG